jgi:hypothetical protein
MLLIGTLLWLRIDAAEEIGAAPVLPAPLGPRPASS